MLYGSADRILEQFNASQSSGLEFGTYQAFVKAAGRYGVDVNDVRSSLVQFQSQVKAAVSSPDSDLGKYFAKIGVEAQGADGQIRSMDDLLGEVMVKANTLKGAERLDFLAKMFGEDDVAKLMPLMNDLTSGAVDLNKELAALKASGTFIDDAAVARARALKGAVNDVKTSFEGLQQRALVVAGPALQEWLQALAAGIGRFGDLTMGWLYRWAQGSRVLLRDLAVLWEGGWEGANDGIESYEQQWASVNAMAKQHGLELQSFAPRTPIQNRWLIDLRNGLSWVDYLARKAAPAVKLLFSALAGDAAANRELPWVKHLQTGLFAAGRLAREVILTIGGDTGMVTEFPWLLKLREGLAGVGRFARETFYAAVNDRDRVQEFPWLLTVRDGIARGIELARRFGFELWSAIRGQDENVGGYQFAWIPKARDAIVQFGQDVRRVWADLGAVWGGERDAMTGPGAMLAKLMKSFDDFQAYVTSWQVWFKQVGQDVALVWSQIGKTKEEAAASLAGLNFPGAKDLADSFLFVANAAKQGWGWFKACYDALFALVGLVGINLESSLFFLAFFKFTGTLAGLKFAADIVMKPLKWLKAFLGLGGGAAAAAAGTAGAAGAVTGLTTALGSLKGALGQVAAFATNPLVAAIFGGVGGGLGIYALAQGDGPLSFLRGWTDKLADWVNGTDAQLKEVEAQFARNAEVGGASPLNATLAAGKADARDAWAQQMERERQTWDALPAPYVPPPPVPMQQAQAAYTGPRSEIPPVPIVFRVENADGEGQSYAGYMDQDVLARARAAANRGG